MAEAAKYCLRRRTSTWEGHPLRKDYPVQVKLPVKTYEPLQLTEEEFRANVEADRRLRRS